MAMFKCKMCGGALEITPGQTVCECEYCGSTQTLPKMDDERKANLYDRANHFRRNNEFDKAAGVYERLLSEDAADAEAYWSLVLCRYGIEYVEDPATKKRVPTVNRAQYTSIFDDDNYKQALAHADISQKIVYENEAKAINEIQRGILAISQKEEPFDVFICYKETDANGRRTMDSVLANDLYHQLTQEGFKVFFSRITLEDKLGIAYEPYIFAALNSARVMVVVGTRAEYLNAVWVKNEWSRYLALVKQSAGKKVLIPAYRDMDPYDLPEEFSHLQAQDMSKLGFMQDLVRGIKKILGDGGEKQPPQAMMPQTVLQQTVVKAGGETAPLLKRAQFFLEDGDFKSAAEYADRILDIDPECSRAYMVKVLAAKRCRNEQELEDKCADKELGNVPDLQKAIRFAEDGGAYRRMVESAAKNAAFVGAAGLVGVRLDARRGVSANTAALRQELERRVKQQSTAETREKNCRQAAQELKKLGDYPQAAECAALCEKLADLMPIAYQYGIALGEFQKVRCGDDWKRCRELSVKFAKLEGFRDSGALSREAAELAERFVNRQFTHGMSVLKSAFSYQKLEEAFASLKALADEKTMDEAEAAYACRKKELDEREARIAAEVAADKRKKTMIIVAVAVAVFALGVYLLVIAPMMK